MMAIGDQPLKLGLLLVSFYRGPFFLNPRRLGRSLETLRAHGLFCISRFPWNILISSVVPSLGNWEVWLVVPSFETWEVR